jgi:hypothetical protein
MAKVTLAPGFENLHGLVGKLLCRLFLGMNIVYPKPKRVGSRTRRRNGVGGAPFREGTAYAKRVSKDPANMAGLCGGGAEAAHHRLGAGH